MFTLRNAGALSAFDGTAWQQAQTASGLAYQRKLKYTVRFRVALTCSEARAARYSFSFRRLVR